MSVLVGGVWCGESIHGYVRLSMESLEIALGTDDESIAVLLISIIPSSFFFFFN
jgi:hypothetical protein